MGEFNHDDMLFSMLKDCKTLQFFFDEIFGFLHRRTDFYYIAKDNKSTVGLPDGMAELIVKEHFFKWKHKNVPIPTESEPIVNGNEIPIISEEVIAEAETKSIPTLNICEKKVKRQPVFNSSESYNGATFENYSWSQNIHDVDIIVKLPGKITAKELSIDVFPNYLSVKRKGEILLEGELCQKCKQNDVIWSLLGNKLEIHLEKGREMWWNCFLITEPKLDLSQIDCSRPFEDLPEEAQAKIEELQWNQERKRLGLPTSDEICQRHILRKAWNVEGSPFSGPFDPSAITFG